MSTNFFIRFSFFLLAFMASSLSYSQMLINGETKYGNEWIDFNATYYKVKVGENGIYQLSGQTLETSGLALSGLKGSQFQLWHNGQEVPIFTSSENEFTLSDYLQFYGEKNTITLDSFMYKNWKNELLNPEYSLITDTSAYFLTVSPNSNNKRIVSYSPDYSNNSLTPTMAFTHTEKVVFSNQLYKPTEGELFKYSNFVKGEGYCAPFSTNDNFHISATERVDLGESAKLTIRMGNNGVAFNKKIITFNGELLDTTLSNANAVQEIVFDIPFSSLKDDNVVNIRNFGLNDQHVVAFISLSYTKKVGLTSNHIEKITTNNSKYFEFSGSSELIALDITNQRYLQLDELGGNEYGLLTGPNVTKLILTDRVNNIQNIQQYKFTDLSTLNPDYLIITSPKLYKTSGGNVDQINNYADYRRSSQGGGFDVYIMMIDEIYNQFGYGIENHAYSFKNMTHFLDNAWPKLEYAFIIGKGREYRDIRTKAQIEDPLNATYFIPTYGESPSDNLLFSTGDSPRTHFAVGRIAVGNMNEVGYYLDKVKMHDLAINAPQTKDKLWLKRIMHLGGGSTNSEQNDIKSHYMNMANEITNNLFGGQVFSYYKNSNIDIQLADRNEIFKTVNDGLSILAFFGHASVGVFDYALDDAKNYHNEGKLPFLFSLGCYSGNICTSSKGVGENFVLTPKVGAVGFVASSGTALLSTQGEFGENFYQELGDTYYNETIGKIFYDINAKQESSTSLYVKTLHQQLTLFSDPALRLHGFTGPDYTIDYNSIKLNPLAISLIDSSYELSFDVLNLGKYTADSIDVEINHILENGDTSYSQFIRIKSPAYKSNVKVVIPTPDLNGLGMNRIELFVDALEEEEEISESNNKLINEDGQLGYTFIITNSGVKPIYPINFGIVNKNMPVVLKGSTTNLFAPIQDYIIQLDTTEKFNSPFLQETIVKEVASLVEWAPNITFEEGRVYYWRIAPTNADNNKLNWEPSSFIYLSESKEGWNQSHYYQWLYDKSDGIVFEKGSEQQFVRRKRSVKVRSEVFRSADVPTTIVDGNPWRAVTPFGGSKDIIQIQAWGDKGLVFNPAGLGFGNLPWDVNATFAFDPNTLEGRKGIKDLLEWLPDSTQIFINFYIANNQSTFDIPSWKSDSLTIGYNIYSVFEKYGATKVRELETKGLLPYIYYFQKGRGKINEIIGNDILEQITLTGDGQQLRVDGKLASVNVGPAKTWDQFFYQVSQLEPSDHHISKLFVKKSLSDAGILYKSFNISGVYDIADIDPKIYPYIRLENWVDDSLNRTPANLDHWRITYDAPTDLAFLKDKNFEFNSLSLDQGDIIKLTTTIKNITDKATEDSTVCNISTSNSFNNVESISYRIPKLLPGEEFLLKAELNTSKMVGEYQLVAEINNLRNIVEQNYFNNLGVAMIKVLPDTINPNMNVTFDGIHIMDGDIVGSNPQIKVLLRDENRFFLLKEPDLFKLSLKKSGETEATIIDLNSPEITFTKSNDLNNNEAELIYNPTLGDGEYKLLVQSRDASGNSSGFVQYEVNFVVQNKKSISNLYNYPNPFSSSTRFVFTITGSIPENMTIQIMTVSGKVVKEISKNELGHIKLGNNISEYAWDGTDAYGAKLGNGVYYYRLIMDNESDFERYNKDKNNKAFVKGFGKLVILR